MFCLPAPSQPIDRCVPLVLRCKSQSKSPTRSRLLASYVQVSLMAAGCWKTPSDESLFKSKTSTQNEALKYTWAMLHLHCMPMCHWSLWNLQFCFSEVLQLTQSHVRRFNPAFVGSDHYKPVQRGYTWDFSSLFRGCDWQISPTHTFSNQYHAPNYWA